MFNLNLIQWFTLNIVLYPSVLGKSIQILHFQCLSIYQDVSITMSFKFV